MDITTNCPDCSAKVRVPDTLLGRSVKCPKCQTVFKAESPEAPDPGYEEVPEEEDERPRRRRPAPVEDEEGDDYEPRPRRRWKQPHRGSTILVLGILSLVMGCFPLGIAAWVMGNTDMTAMRRGTMDRSGEGTTQAGRVCGMISTILAIVGCVGYALLIIIALLAGGPRGKF